MRLRYLGIILVFFLVLGAVSATDASDLSVDDFKDIKFSDKDVDVSVDGHDFTIPKGYGALEKISGSDTENGVTQDFKFYADEEGNVIMICVMSGNINLELDTYDTLGENPQKMTINGHDGTLLENSDYYFFVYVDGDNVVLLQAKEKDLFDKILSE